MPNGTYGGVRGTETKVGQKTFVSRPTRLTNELYLLDAMKLVVKNLGIVDYAEIDLSKEYFRGGNIVP